MVNPCAFLIPSRSYSNCDNSFSNNMEQNTPNTATHAYMAPAFRILILSSEINFLASNTEPIIDDGEEHGWD